MLSCLHSRDEWTPLWDPGAAVKCRCPFCSLCHFGSNVQEVSSSLGLPFLQFYAIKLSKWVSVNRWLNQNTFSKDNLDLKCNQEIKSRNFSPYSQLETDREKKLVIRDLSFNKPGKDLTSVLRSKALQTELFCTDDCSEDWQTLTAVNARCS